MIAFQTQLQPKLVISFEKQRALEGLLTRLPGIGNVVVSPFDTPYEAVAVILGICSTEDIQLILNGVTSKIVQWQWMFFSEEICLAQLEVEVYINTDALPYTRTFDPLICEETL